MRKPLHTCLNHRKAVIFDLDGTMFNTEPLHANSIKTALEKFEKSFSEEYLHREFYGYSDHEVFISLFPNSTADKIIQFIAHKNTHLADQIDQLSRSDLENLMTPGLKEGLICLQRNNINMAVVSASEELIVNIILKRSGLSDYFSYITPRQGTFRSKPSSSPYLRTLRQLQLKTNEVLVFEDSPTGIEAALTAGLDVVQVASFTPVNSKLPQNLHVIDNFSWLNSLLDK
jgi:beta-phosphoglucomutase